MPRSKNAVALTAVRGPVHGNFAEGASITQTIMDMLSRASSWPRMNAAQKEAIHMSVHKIHRIVTGNPHHKDHWDDIGGYAELGSQACEGEHEVAGPSLRAARKRVRKPARIKKVKARPAKPAKKVKARKPIRTAAKKAVRPRPVKKAAKKRVRPARVRTAAPMAAPTTSDQAVA